MSSVLMSRVTNKVYEDYNTNSTDNENNREDCERGMEQRGGKEGKSEGREEGKTRGDSDTENSALRYCRSFKQTRVVGFAIPFQK